MIVAIHTYPLTILSENIDIYFTKSTISYYCSLLFMITGYFVLPVALKEKKKLKHTL